MGDIPLWPFFLPSDHPNKRYSETLSTLEAQQKYAVDTIIPLIKQHLSSIRTNTSNGLRKYASLHTYVDSWLKKWTPHIDVKGFWQSISKGYQPPSYGPGAPGASPYAPGASPYAPGASPYAPGAPLTLRTGPYTKQSYRGGPILVDPILAGLAARGAVHGIGAMAGATAQGVQMTGDAMASAGQCLGDAGQCLVGTGECLAPVGDCIGCCMQGGIRKKKRKTLRRRRCKKRTRKTRRV